MLTIILVSVLVSVRGYYSNGQARECIDNIAINEKCLKELHECFSEGSCSSEYKQYEKCTIDEDNNIFNGYCFREWAENAITTKPVIDCLVRECNLIYNSQYNILDFYDCSREVLEKIGDQLDCDEECLEDMGQVKSCLQVKPYDECYDFDNGVFHNPKAIKILQDIKATCLNASNEHLNEPNKVDNEL
jgi:hypothetical protein